ncbi:MAG: MotA/TolQ/ExbB proton channel family protein [Gammaproteobacteria bacterium]|nr:MotA/TolQ/ExbB proton channel family protein [Gammaproteobacteria bacterium]
MTIFDLFFRGGPVVWVLAGYSVLGLAIVLERCIHYLRMGRAPQDLEARIRAATAGDERALEGTGGPEAAVVGAMLAARAEGVRDLAHVGQRVRAVELRRLEGGFSTLAILGNTAPLLGLFGTITGMIKAFMVIEQAGGKVDAQALAGGIWEAMITTGAGLAVAIPLLILLHFLENTAERRAHAMQRCVSLVLEQIGRNGNGRHGSEGSGEDREGMRHREAVANAL